MTGDDFASKVFRGDKPTADDWNTFLRDAHARDPSMTPKAYVALTLNGNNSYEILADSLASLPVDRPAVVLDLGCGDGHLVPHCLQRLSPASHVHGVDMSEGELNVARRNVTSSQATFHLAMAQELPLADAAVDVVLSHMALMLMVPIEPVVKELRRVLRPGGFVAAVTGVSKTFPEGSLRAGIQRIISDGFKSSHPTIGSPKMGDPRISSRAGLEELFVKDFGFSEVEDDRIFEVKGRIHPERVWAYFETKYLIPELPSEALTRMRADVAALASRFAGDDGLVELESPMRLFRIRK